MTLLAQGDHGTAGALYGGGCRCGDQSRNSITTLVDAARPRLRCAMQPNTCAVAESLGTWLTVLDIAIAEVAHARCAAADR
jgi:hypothetical protein